MVRGEIVLNEGLVVLSEDREVDAEQLIVFRSLKKDGAILEVLDHVAVDGFSRVCVKIPVRGEGGKGGCKSQ